MHILHKAYYSGGMGERTDVPLAQIMATA